MKVNIPTASFARGWILTALAPSLSWSSHLAPGDAGVFQAGGIRNSLDADLLLHVVLSLRPLDRLLQRWRISKAVAWIRPDDRVLDIGCHEGELFRALPGLPAGVGLEPELKKGVGQPPHQFLQALFPHPQLLSEDFDAITLLAVIEHFPAEQLAAVVQECQRVLRPGGRVILTVPSPLVDTILAWLRRLRLIDGMDLHQHYGFDPAQLPRLFAPPHFRLLWHGRFQLGLNNLFVFQKP